MIIAEIFIAVYLIGIVLPTLVLCGLAVYLMIQSRKIEEVRSRVLIFQTYKNQNKK